MVTLFGKANKDQRAELFRAYLKENKSFTRIAIVLKEVRETVRQLSDKCVYKTRQQMIDCKEYGSDAQVDSIIAGKLRGGQPLWRPHPDAPHDENLRQFWVHKETEGSQINRSSTRIEASAEVTGENLEQLQCEALAQLFSDNTDPIHSGGSTVPPMRSFTTAPSLPSAPPGQCGTELSGHVAGAHGGQPEPKKDKTKKDKKDKREKKQGKEKKQGRGDTDNAPLPGGGAEVDSKKTASKKKNMSELLADTDNTCPDNVSDKIRGWATALLHDLGEAVQLHAQLSLLPDCQDRCYTVCRCKSAKFQGFVCMCPGDCTFFVCFTHCNREVRLRLRENQNTL